MAKAKKPMHDDSQIQEIDLNAIDLSNININLDTSPIEKPKLPPKKKVETIKEPRPKTKESDFGEGSDDCIGGY